MREHLFRGIISTCHIGKEKNVIKNFWVYGSLVRNINCPASKCSDYSIMTDKEKDGDELRTIINVANGTVGEYIGKTDKNDKMIFEDDIVKWTCYKGETNEITRIGKVLWDEEMCRFSLAEAGGSFYWNISTNRDREYEVIGNIYDNPELLGGMNNVD